MRLPGGRSVGYLDFRPATRADEDRLAAWLADEVRAVELIGERLREALLVHCRSDRVEQPGRSEPPGPRC
ncbi:hypothetical protein [Streptomyces albicerus]|uniref:hypothetical protein n=1 Tax=Streptomyces albicerus TaxID=2569859 RepID=UPI00124AE949|nr:hypothetical protein [Streptomyces albicerus]